MAATTYKDVLFGYESDLGLDTYVVCGLKRHERISLEKLNDDALRGFKTRDEALSEAQSCVVDQGRKNRLYVVYAARMDRLSNITQYEAIATCEKVKPRPRLAAELWREQTEERTHHAR